jgi:hypothetical protein
MGTNLRWRGLSSKALRAVFFGIDDGRAPHKENLVGCGVLPLTQACPITWADADGTTTSKRGLVTHVEDVDTMSIT